MHCAKNWFLLRFVLTIPLVVLRDASGFRYDPRPSIEWVLDEAKVILVSIPVRKDPRCAAPSTLVAASYIYFPSAPRSRWLTYFRRGGDCLGTHVLHPCCWWRCYSFVVGSRSCGLDYFLSPYDSPATTLFWRLSLLKRGACRQICGGRNGSGPPIFLHVNSLAFSTKHAKSHIVETRSMHLWNLEDAYTIIHIVDVSSPGKPLYWFQLHYLHQHVYIRQKLN